MIDRARKQLVGSGLQIRSVATASNVSQRQTIRPKGGTALALGPVGVRALFVSAKTSGYMTVLRSAVVRFQGSLSSRAQVPLEEIGNKADQFSARRSETLGRMYGVSGRRSRSHAAGASRRERCLSGIQVSFAERILGTVSPELARLGDSASARWRHSFITQASSSGGSSKWSGRAWLWWGRRAMRSGQLPRT